VVGHEESPIAYVVVHTRIDINKSVLFTDIFAVEQFCLEQSQEFISVLGFECRYAAYDELIVELVIKFWLFDFTQVFSFLFFYFFAGLVKEVLDLVLLFELLSEINFLVEVDHLLN